MCSFSHLILIFVFYFFVLEVKTPSHLPCRQQVVLGDQPRQLRRCKPTWGFLMTTNKKKTQKSCDGMPESSKNPKTKILTKITNQKTWMDVPVDVPLSCVASFDWWNRCVVGHIISSSSSSCRKSRVRLFCTRFCLAFYKMGLRLLKLNYPSPSTKEAGHGIFVWLLDVVISCYESLLMANNHNS